MTLSEFFNTISIQQVGVILFACLIFYFALGFGLWIFKCLIKPLWQEHLEKKKEQKEKESKLCKNLCDLLDEKTEEKNELQKEINKIVIYAKSRGFRTTEECSLLKEKYNNIKNLEREIADIKNMIALYIYFL